MTLVYKGVPLDAVTTKTVYGRDYNVENFGRPQRGAEVYTNAQTIGSLCANMVRDADANSTTVLNAVLAGVELAEKGKKP